MSNFPYCHPYLLLNANNRNAVDDAIEHIFQSRIFFEPSTMPILGDVRLINVPLPHDEQMFLMPDKEYILKSSIVVQRVGIGLLPLGPDVILCELEDYDVLGQRKLASYLNTQAFREAPYTAIHNRILTQKLTETKPQIERSGYGGFAGFDFPIYACMNISRLYGHDPRVVRDWTTIDTKVGLKPP